VEGLRIHLTECKIVDATGKVLTEFDAAEKPFVDVEEGAFVAPWEWKMDLFVIEFEVTSEMKIVVMARMTLQED
jgi:hypothetical protein